MNRRSAISSWFQKDQNSTSKMMALPVAGGLNPYNGTWNYASAAHLLRRTTFGVSHASILQAVNDGLAKTIQKLLEAKDLTLVPLPAPQSIHLMQMIQTCQLVLAGFLHHLVWVIILFNNIE